MNPTLKTIAELDTFEIYALFEEIFDKTDTGPRLVRLLNAMRKPERKEFWETLKPLGKMWLRGGPPESSFTPDADPSDVLDDAQLAEDEQVIGGILDQLDSLVNAARARRDEQLQEVLQNREILKARMPDFLSDQHLGIPVPSPVKDYPPGSTIIDLPEPTDAVIRISSIFQCIKQRRSHRSFTAEPLSLPELSYLLWATQGVREFFPGRKGSFRNVPSGGARHPMETYLAVNHVAGLTAGIYRYLPFEHRLLFQRPVEGLKEKLAEYAYDQQFVGWCAVCFIWTAIPYRIEWRYGPEAKKDVLQEAGHICQNLYLACESIHCGTCGINAYNQEKVDDLIDVDGRDEMTVYLSPVGRVEQSSNPEMS
ncbi:MAG TPA: SagB/ThcOx family dehydrogenase [bacterium]|nr:SagB/ThcOx family dehydrogenase [bacterium]